MSLYKRGSIWYYDFWFQGGRHNASTGQMTKSDAEQYESDSSDGSGGSWPASRRRRRWPVPRFQDWAEVHFRERRPQ